MSLCLHDLFEALGGFHLTGAAPWGNLSGAIQCYLGLSGAIWVYLNLSGAIWNYLGLATWDYLGPS